MKNNWTLIRVVLVMLTFLTMAMLIWGVWTGRLLDQKETREQMMDEMINKIK